jgi:hypothetical protein
MPVAVEADSVPGMPEDTSVAAVVALERVAGGTAGGAEASLEPLAGGEAVSTAELLEGTDDGGAPLETGTVPVMVESVETRVVETVLTVAGEGATASVELPGTPKVPGTPAVPGTGVQVGSVLATKPLAYLCQSSRHDIPLRLTITRF